MPADAMPCYIFVFPLVCCVFVFVCQKLQVLFGSLATYGHTRWGIEEIAKHLFCGDDTIETLPTKKSDFYVALYAANTLISVAIKPPND